MILGCHTVFPYPKTNLTLFDKSWVDILEIGVTRVEYIDAKIKKILLPLMNYIPVRSGVF